MKRRVYSCAAIGLLTCLLGMPVGTAYAQEDDECLFCHGEADFSVETEGGATRSLFVDPETFAASMHGQNGCVSCHADIEEIPHPEDLAPVDCSVCHDQAVEYAQSLHGTAEANGDALAPHCWSCHGAHDILTRKNPKSRTNPIHVPRMCGQCHAENAPVAQSRNVSQHDILVNYEQSLHSKGMQEKGLTVTAVCTSCHTAHHVLPHTDPQSTIYRGNIVTTCTQCHALIEEVHRKIIDGKLWEAEPDKVPICIDCHQPHKARKVYYDEGVSDKDCMLCHAQAVQGEEKLLGAVDSDAIAASTHTSVRCAQCHTGADPSLDRPCASSAPVVDCSICHNDQVTQYGEGIHGRLLAEGDPDAPACLDCHLGHGTQSKNDPASPTFAKNVPSLCGRCHQEGKAAASRGRASQRDVIANYSMSIHGKGLLESGLVVTATCVSCHTAHRPLPASDPESTVHLDRIPTTCGKCHNGVQEQFEKSIHSPLVSDTSKPLPVCSGCHTAHTISRTDAPEFVLDVMGTCGHCHEDVAETYFETYHGKVSKLGSETAAKCHDCHGAHDVLPVTDPASKLSRNNIVATCAQCHEGSHRRFAGYLTHATHHDPQKYPILFATFWAMTLLLAGTFAFFGLHTLAWLPHSFQELRTVRAEEAADTSQRRFSRFDPVVRQLHFVLILCFFGLALTGMALKFSYMPWALWISHAFGGFQTMGTIHRFCAVIMTILFITHLFVIAHRKRRSGLSWFRLLTGEDSLVPNRRDAAELFQTIRWFLHKGPRPQYGRWTYWEKFDYFAVFWGIAIIGSTGFILWFPELCTHILPGWFINVATIIHSDEALLAVGFIFTVHFFNTHFRPEKFPMDMAMFTGRIPLSELKRERPRQYKQLEESGELERYLLPEAPKEIRVWSAIFGTIAVIVGLSLVLFILWSMIFGYR